MSNLALFVTHNVFLTKEQIEELLSGTSIETVGHCVPVWVDAKTGKTTEPASEVFCNYKIYNEEGKDRDIIFISKKGFKIFVPNKINWSPPKPLNFEELGAMSSEERQLALKERDKWWFENPKPHDLDNLKNGYMRLEIKKTNQKIKRKEYSAQHIIEIATWNRLKESLTT